MALGTMAKLSAAVFLVVFLAMVAKDARAGPDTSTVIIECNYPGYSLGSPFSVVNRVEIDGPISPQIFINTPCVEAFNTLSKSGFKLMHSYAGTPADGHNGSDFTVWRSR